MGRKPLFNQPTTAAERKRRSRAKAGKPVTQPDTVTDDQGFYIEPLFFNPGGVHQAGNVTNDEVIIMMAELAALSCEQLATIEACVRLVKERHPYWREVNRDTLRLKELEAEKERARGEGIDAWMAFGTIRPECERPELKQWRDLGMEKRILEEGIERRAAAVAQHPHVLDDAVIDEFG